MAGAQHFIQRVNTSKLPLPRREPEPVRAVQGRFARLTAFLRFARREGQEPEQQGQQQQRQQNQMQRPAPAPEGAERGAKKSAGSQHKGESSKRVKGGKVTKTRKPTPFLTAQMFAGNAGGQVYKGKGKSGGGAAAAGQGDDDDGGGPSETTTFLQRVAAGQPIAMPTKQGLQQPQKTANQPQKQLLQPRPLPLPQEDLPGPPPPYTTAEINAIRSARCDLDDREDIILLENMSNGSVHNLIYRLVERQQHLSNRMLWLIFECLFKSCVAMAYPERWWEPGRDAWIEAMRLVDERVPLSAVPVVPGGPVRLPERPMVHFDLDPQNVLIGDFGQPGQAHSIMPVFKVADPGLSQIINDKTRECE
ncbi:hypothetical protein BD289DRAFT_487563 [Coniella lustricola]|uniref:Protein kinase domain-containing protein n=1 Tax=Coniella lustricola TaxID=2025994 RepID=A0A2T2ZRL5_9PEZI|nr:hypothetical protein BD289DRAFT_487563 [Coniella lustricola]